jgi:hypothetical protein
MRQFLGAVLAATTLGVVAAPAQAHVRDGSLRPVDRQVLYCMTADFRGHPNLVAAAHYAIWNLADQTVFTWSFLENCGDSPNIDIVFGITALPGVRGWYDCAVPYGSVCARAEVRLNPSLLTNQLNRRKTACHEVGHYGTLAHYSGSGGHGHEDCMKSGAVSSGHQQYNGSHVHILNHSTP